MPFGFGRRKDQAPEEEPQPQAEPEPAARHPGARGVAFEALTEEWRLLGVMDLDARLTDALNKREPIAIRDVRWAPIDKPDQLEAAPGLRSVDPYDLIVVLAGDDSLPPLTEAERAALKIHKVAYDVALELPPFRVVGTIFLFAGSEPVRLLDRGTEMFVPVTDATAMLGDRQLSETDSEVVLVNRSYLRGVEQLDPRTRDTPQSLPGGAA